MGEQITLLMGIMMLQERVVHQGSIDLQDDGVLQTLFDSEAKESLSANTLRNKEKLRQLIKFSSNLLMPA
ncbi:MAG: hypothetical protein ACJA13_001282 [Paraglaciecola sp.]|jgi:hypothetical protein